MNRIIAYLLLMFCVGVTQAQEKPEIVKQAIDSKNYVFTAQSATAQRGRTRQLTGSDYTLVVRPDTIDAYLPYYGRAYNAPIDPSESGIKFTSSQFEYAIKEGKKKSWQITITPKDVSDTRQLYLEVFENGRTSVRVTSNNKESISFDGYITEGKPLDK